MSSNKIDVMEIQLDDQNPISILNQSQNELVESQVDERANDQIDVQEPPEKNSQEPPDENYFPGFSDSFSYTNQIFNNLEFDDSQIGFQTSGTNQSTLQSVEKIEVNKTKPIAKEKGLRKKKHKDEIKMGKKQKTRSQCKNYLALIKRCLLKYYELYEIRNERIQGLINANHNLAYFDNLFRQPELKLFFKRIFSAKSLKRELQNSRMDKENRQLFMKKVTFLQRTFLDGSFTNL